MNTDRKSNQELEKELRWLDRKAEYLELKLERCNARREAIKDALSLHSSYEPPSERPAESISVVPKAESLVNYNFYKNKIRSKPKGATIDTIHAEWIFNYNLLEESHTYIQWLFPIFKDAGQNAEAKPLTREEARKIRTEVDCSFRVLDSYKMMLNFWGFQLVNPLTGEVKRHESDKFALSRFLNIVVHQHNCLRIARVLISLGQLGFSLYKKGFLAALRREVTPNSENKPGPLTKCQSSLTDWWAPACLEDDSPDYHKRTLENGPEDRAPSILFEHILANSADWQQYVTFREKFDEEMIPVRKSSNEKAIQQAIDLFKQGRA